MYVYIYTVTSLAMKFVFPATLLGSGHLKTAWNLPVSNVQ